MENEALIFHKRQSRYKKLYVYVVLVYSFSFHGWSCFRVVLFDGANDIIQLLVSQDKSSVLTPASSFRDTSSYNDSIGDTSTNVCISLQMISHTIISLIIIIKHQSLNIIIKNIHTKPHFGHISHTLIFWRCELQKNAQQCNLTTIIYKQHCESINYYVM